MAQWRQAMRRGGEAALLDTAKEVAEQADAIFGPYLLLASMSVMRLKDVLCEGKIYADVKGVDTCGERKIREAVRDTGVKSADAAMLGSFQKTTPGSDYRFQRNGADTLKEMMTPYGMKITTGWEKAGAPGNQAGEKYLYEGNCLPMIEMLQAADAYDVSEEVVFFHYEVHG